MTLAVAQLPQALIPERQTEEEEVRPESQKLALSRQTQPVIQSMYTVVETDIERSDWLTDPKRINEVASPWARRCFARLDALAQRYEELRNHKPNIAQLLEEEPIIRSAVAWKQFNVEDVLIREALRRNCTSLPGIARVVAGKINTVIGEIRDSALCAPKEVEVRDTALSDAARALDQLGTNLQIVTSQKLLIDSYDHEIDINSHLLREAFGKAHAQAEETANRELTVHTKQQTYIITFVAQLCSQINQIVRTELTERHSEGINFELLLKTTRWGHALNAFEGKTPQINTEIFNAIMLLIQMLSELDNVTSRYTLACNARAETMKQKIQLETSITQLQTLYAKIK